MNSRTVWTLVLAAAALFAFIVLIERRWDTPDIAKPPGKILLQLRGQEVTSIQVLPPDRLEIRVERTNGLWHLVRPVDAPANPTPIEALLNALAALEAHTHITARELRDRPEADKEFGFDPPHASLILQSGTHRSQVLVGRRTALGDQVFLQVVGAEGIYVVDARLVQLLPRDAADWRNMRLAHWPPGSGLDRIQIIAGGKILELQRDAPVAPWRMTRPMDARADNPRINDLLQKLQALHWTSFVTDDPLADLELFGLNPPDWELQLLQGTNLVWALQVGRSPTNAPGLVHARVRGRPTVGLVSHDELAAWRADVRDFRERRLVVPGAEPVNWIEARGSGEFALFRGPDHTWQLAPPARFRVDQPAANELLGTLTGLTMAQFVKDVVTDLDLPSYGLAPPKRQFVLRGGAGGGTNLLLAQLDFGDVQEDRVFVRLGDEKSVAAVRLADYQRLPASDWQLRERRIWNFAPADVTQLTIRQHGKTRELLHTGTNAWAFAPGSQGVINDFGVEETVHRLGELSAVVWVARGETNRALYGLAPAAHQLTLAVRVGNTVQPHQLEIGARAPSGFPYAAVQLEDEWWIFELPLALHHFVETYLSFPPDNP